MFWLRQSTANQKVSVLMRNSDGSNLGSLDGTAEIFKNDGTFESPSDGSWMDDKGRDGWYSVQVDATDTATLGKFGVNANESAALDFDDYGYVISANEFDSRFSTDKLQVDVREVDGTAVTPDSLLDGTNANLVSIDGALTNGNNATLNLKQLNVVNAGGSAIVATSDGSDGHGMILQGNGTGEGINTTGGANGDGVRATGGSSSGHGMIVNGGGSGGGLYCIATGNGHGIRCDGNGSGEGLTATGGATGSGMMVTAGGGNNHGASFVGAGTGKDLSATTTDSLEVNITKTNGNEYIDGTIDLTEHAQKVHAALVNATSGDGTDIDYKDTDGSTLWTASYPGTTGTRTVS